jgi:hypothetical protein
MLLSDLIRQFDDETVAAEALVALGDLALTARIAVAAAEQDATLGEFAVVSVQGFAAWARDEDWVTVLGQMGRSDDPGRVFLSYVLHFALAREPGYSPASVGAAG